MSGVVFLWSADYELFLGANFGSEERVLVAPTAALLSRAREEGIPLTFFADVACWWRYRELGRNRFPEAAEGQLRQARLAGHDVQLHLHPHWSVTDWQEGEAYHFPPEHYLLGRLGASKGETLAIALAMITRGRDHLEGLLRPVDARYRCVAFRAGGYGLQPGAELIFAALTQAGIRIDSSVVPGLVMADRYHQVDFRSWPSGAHRFQPGGGWEIPVGAWSLDRWQALRWLTGPAMRAAVRAWRGMDPFVVRGRSCETPGVPVVAGRWRRAWWRFHGRFGQRLLRLELQTEPALLEACAALVIDRELRRGGVVYLACNAHPKAMGPEQLVGMARLADFLRRRYRHEIRFALFRDVADELQ